MPLRVLSLVLAGGLLAGITAVAQTPAPTAGATPAPAAASPISPAAPEKTATTPDAPPPIDPAKVAAIREMIEATGVLQSMDVVKIRMIGMLKNAHPELPSNFWTRMQSEMDTGELIDQLIPIYAKYYSMDDLKSINAFYESPVGRHMAETRSPMAAESMEIGQRWGRALGLKIMTEIEKEKAKTAAPAASTH